MQRLLGRAALLDQFAQVAVPDNHRRDQYPCAQQDLQDKPAVVVPEAVADQRIGSPAAGQFGHFVGGDAEQGFVEDRVQLCGVTAHGKGENARLVTVYRGNLQPILEHAADKIGSVDLRAQGHIGLALRHRFHQRQRVIDGYQCGLRVAQTQLGFDRGDVTYQRQALAVELCGAAQAGVVSPGDQYSRGNQVRASEAQSAFASRGGRQHTGNIDMT
ncbi:hypothetical protein D3C84_705670 [compost metagenome]